MFELSDTLLAPRRFRTQADVDAIEDTSGDVFDALEPGFHVRCNALSKTYRVAVNVGPKKIMRKIGRTDAIKLRDAREQAKRIKSEYRRELRAAPKTRRLSSELTFARAFEIFNQLHADGTERAHAPRTRDGYQHHFETTFADWHDESLLEIGRDPDRLRERFVHVAELRGPSAANTAFRFFRSLYNDVAADRPDFPPFPRSIPWRKEERRDAAYSPKELSNVFSIIVGMSSGIRACLYLFLLFSGVRDQAGREARWSKVDLDRRTLFIPNTKGKPQTVPLSPIMVSILTTARALSEAQFGGEHDWIFATLNRRGEVTCIQETKTSALPVPAAYREWVQGRKLRGVARTAPTEQSAGIFRHTYATAAKASGLSGYDFAQLLNHSLNGVRVSEGYTLAGASLDHLHKCQAQVSRYILTQIRRPVKTLVTAEWLAAERGVAGMV